LSRVFNGDLGAFESAVNHRFDFTGLDDFGETMHRNIYEWFGSEDNIKLWKELQTMVNVDKKVPAVQFTEGMMMGNPFIGRTIVVTGKLEYFTRDSINAKIESLGAKAGSSVSKNTDYLICGEKAGSKLDKARTLGVKVLTEQEFLAMEKGA
jgi:DNA ligase (NAD+)